MKETLKSGAGITSVLTTFLFAALLWWYSTQGYRDEPINWIILIGLVIIVMDILTIWSLSTSVKKTKKKGRK